MIELLIVLGFVVAAWSVVGWIGRRISRRDGE